MLTKPLLSACHRPYGQLPTLQIDDDAPVAQSWAMLRYAGALATSSTGVSLYPTDRLLEVEEALGLVGDLERDWRPAVGLALTPAAYGYPDGFKGTPDHDASVQRPVVAPIDFEHSKAAQAWSVQRCCGCSHRSSRSLALALATTLAGHELGLWPPTLEST